MAKVTAFDNLIAQLLVGGGITWVKTKLWWDFDVSLSDEIIYKAYYEFRNWCARKNISDFVDSDAFIDVIVDVIKLVEEEADRKLLEDPDFIRVSLKKNAWLWRIYSFFRNYVTSENVKLVAESPVTKAIDKYLNSVMIQNPLLLEYKVHRDVDFAIEDYQVLTDEKEEVIIEKPIFSEVKEGDTPLGGEMRLSAPYKTENES